MMEPLFDVPLSDLMTFKNVKVTPILPSGLIKVPGQ